MQKRKANWSALGSEEVFWYLASAYVADAVGLLDASQDAKLSQLTADEQHVVSWQSHMRQQLSVDDAFVRTIFAYCTEQRTAEEAIAFILGGLGCRDGRRHARRILG